MIENKVENVGGAIKWATSRKIAVGHVTTSAESAATWVIYFEVCCHSKQNKGRDSSRSSSRGRGSSRTKPRRGRRGGNSKEQRYVHNVTGDTSAENRVSSNDFYVFTSGSTDGQNTMELMIEDKLINVVIDSGASCNLMSEEMFNFVTGGNARLLSVIREFMLMLL